jgi:3-phosphoshikimate 1-carboxyvinyltransferase
MKTFRINVPGSKSITQRALVAAALAKGASRLRTPLDSEDTRLLRNALSMMGADIDDSGDVWEIQGTSGVLTAPDREIFMGNNGTGIRFMVSVAALADGSTTLEGTERMSERPVEQLLNALEGWGARCRSVAGNGCPPVIVNGGGITGGRTSLVAEKSSQFLSSMLLAAPYAASPAEIVLEGGLVSRPYVDITMAVMSAFGIDVMETGNTFSIPGGCYSARDYSVEGDASSASYFWAAAAITGSSVTVSNMPGNPLQGDAAFADILGAMGCKVTKDEQGVTVTGPPDGQLRGIDIDMERWPDVVPTLAATALFARGETIIRNVPHLRIKETDRLRAMATELSRAGADVRELEDGLVIRGGATLNETEAETYDDHRIAMSMSLVGLRQDGIRILDPSCVGKSFPDFWERWEEMRRSLNI